MRLLKFNNEIVDIDDQTAIGIDYQGYDIQDPGKPKVAISNSFTIPKTSHNIKKIGFAGNPHSLSNDVYNTITVDYYNDNKALIKNGTARVTEVAQRISVMIVEKQNFWSLMADLMWPDALQEIITWMQAEKGLPSVTSPFVGTFQEFIDTYKDTTEGIILPLYISNLAKYQPVETNPPIEDTTVIWIKYQDEFMTVPGLGGHFCLYCKTIFEFIEYKYNVDLSVTSEDYDYNIFQDVIASVMYVAARNISIEYTPTGFYFSVDTQGQFLPETNAEDKASKSLYDFAKTFFQYFNCLIDKIPTTDLSEKYIIRRFDDITNAPVVQFSGGFSGDYTFKPLLDKYKQANYIKFASVYEGGDKLLNSKKITCLNKNIDAGGADSSLITIDAYIPGSVVFGADTLLDLSVSDSFKTFVFFVSEGQGSVSIKAMEEGDERTASAVLNIVNVYSLTGEYNTINSITQYPKMYIHKKWLTLNDIDGLVYFARYFVKELGGHFFLNKISGYNPQKSLEPTTIELIKLP